MARLAAQAERLPAEDRTRAHGVLARFWRTVWERDRERELRVALPEGLEACRHHAGAAGERELFRWASLKLAQLWYRVAEFGHARAVLEGVPEADRDGRCLHALGRVAAVLSEWKLARDLYHRALQRPFAETPEDQKELSAVWHNLASIDLNEGSYPAAREKFDKALAIISRSATGPARPPPGTSWPRST